jgi:ABC-type microcin C transport system permease subunit YejE
LKREIILFRRKKRGVWSFVWFPVALLLALSAGALTGVLGSYY